jgi:hypothetical protein
VRSDNERAKKTYRAMGMEPTGYQVFEKDWKENA